MNISNLEQKKPVDCVPKMGILTFFSWKPQNKNKLIAFLETTVASKLKTNKLKNVVS